MISILHGNRARTILSVFEVVDRSEPLMTSTFRPADIRTIARWALALFVMAWLNLAIQAPVHAAMKQTNPMPCHCDPVLCDTVLQLEQQSDDRVSSMALDFSGFQIAFVTLTQTDAVKSIQPHRFQRVDLDARQTAPPPLLLKTTLHI
mgnify:FL=1